MNFSNIHHIIIAFFILRYDELKKASEIQKVASISNEQDMPTFLFLLHSIITT